MCIRNDFLTMAQAISGGGIYAISHPRSDQFFIVQLCDNEASFPANLLDVTSGKQQQHAIFLYASWFILQLLHSNLISSVSVFYLFFPHDWDHCLTSQLMFLVSIVLSPLPTWPT
ncbi:hypothetical protein PGTUg99_013219 [Puccinia graminis f. sp. tritici]|uniref:Uncharacterized protein n=1 Tax=Puccinia graminis f. sp. tritici TaxID=56615 RepID=A0A5B0RR71_PUCGR|nr:hypothetical protein PGTUg99_013219 [Puccinia graminis f. sp. tritici]